MTKKLIFSCGWLEIPPGGFVDSAEAALFCRESLERCLPRYKRTEAPQGGLLELVREIVVQATGRVDKTLEDAVIASYVAHHQVVERAFRVSKTEHTQQDLDNCWLPERT